MSQAMPECPELLQGVQKMDMTGGGMPRKHRVCFQFSSKSLKRNKKHDSEFFSGLWHRVC
jgi:hypothetical protein